MARCLVFVLAVASLVGPPAAQERLDPQIDAKIRLEEEQHSQIMRTLHFLTDVYGPRLTGSPSLKAAGEWSIKTMEAWGFTNGHLEPWDFDRPGWVNERFTGHVVSPVRDQLPCEVLAWTPGTDGTVTAKAYQMILPERPTPAELTAYLASVKDQVNGKIVLVGKQVFVPVNFSPPAKRRDDQQLRAQYEPDSSAAGQPGAGGGRGTQQAPPRPPMTAAQIDRQIDEFFAANNGKVRVNDAGREHGHIIAFNNRSFDVTKAVPTLVMRNEDYGRIARILADGTPVELEFNIVNRV